jgi:hypothetical protein
MFDLLTQTYYQSLVLIKWNIISLAHYYWSYLRWSEKYDIELYLYDYYSKGTVWDMAVNASKLPSNTLYAVGVFDSVSETSQVQYCSVGMWNGETLSKV